MTSTLTATGIVRDGIQVVDLAQTETGAHLVACVGLDPVECDHLSALLAEAAINGRKRVSERERARG